MRTWTQPYSVSRLLRMISRWTFHSDYTDIEVDEGGLALGWAGERIKRILEARREGRPSRYDPIFDDEQALFRIDDVAIIWARWRELEHLEERLICAIGPACNTTRYNRKTRKLDDAGPADDYGD
jgi:hypothetical protein